MPLGLHLIQWYRPLRTGQLVLHPYSPPMSYQTEWLGSFRQALSFAIIQKSRYYYLPFPLPSFQTPILASSFFLQKELPVKHGKFLVQYVKILTQNRFWSAVVATYYISVANSHPSLGTIYCEIKTSSLASYPNHIPIVLLSFAYKARLKKPYQNYTIPQNYSQR